MFKKLALALTAILVLTGSALSAEYWTTRTKDGMCAVVQTKPDGKSLKLLVEHPFKTKREAMKAMSTPGMCARVQRGAMLCVCVVMTNDGVCLKKICNYVSG
jgi:hypothetical protein